MFQLFAIDGTAHREVFREDLLYRYLRQNMTQVFPMNVVKIIVDDVPYSQGKPLEDVKILCKSKLSGFKGLGQHVQLALDFHRRDSIEFQCFVKQIQPAVNLVKSGFCNEG